MQTSVRFAVNASLRPVKGLRRRIKRAARACGALPREEALPGGVWAVEQGQILLDEAAAFARDARRTPPLPAAEGEPRVTRWAREAVAQGIEMDAGGIVRSARAFFGDREPTQAEIACLPRALAGALLEQADGCLRELLTEIRRDRQARRWARRFCALRAARLPREDAVLRQGIACLRQWEKEEALGRADTLMRRLGRALPDAGDAAARRDARAGRAIAALRRLPRLPWEGIMERLNPVAAILRREETYRRMDEAGRACYRGRTAYLAKTYGVPETAVARAALHLAAGKDGEQGQAGYYLLEKPREIGAYLFSRPFKEADKGKTLLFLLPLWAAAALSLPAAWTLGAPGYTLPGIALCASEAARHVYFAILRRRMPARAVPRLRFRRLNRETRTLIVLPALLTSPRQALRMARQLAVLRSAHPDPWIDCMLLADFADALEQTLPEDDETVSAAREAVRALNETGGGGFYYLHRARLWNGERFAGRERKRGALETLNHLLTDGSGGEEICAASCDLKTLRGRYRYVVTLDADTFLPPGGVHRLVGAMEHPLQKGRIGVIQPRMETAPDAAPTGAQRFLGTPGGADPYGLPGPDVYQDVFGRGSFVGKGIYQPELWLQRTGPALTGEALLSHDLIEGEYAVSALASDIVLYDAAPRTLAGWQRRLHRWTRGDWQLLPHLADRRLPLLSRHKIWDNLRRSLVPPAQTLLLLTGAALSNPFLMLAALPYPFRGMLRRLLLLPGKACTLLDAAGRALYRRFISRRRLLEWTTAAQADGEQLPLPCVLAQALCGTLAALLSLLPGGWLPGAALGALWLAAPLLQPVLDRPVRFSPGMTARQKERMRRLARDTWRFFEDTVGADTHFLPPDNEQTDPPVGKAMRTSPTNIGLYLLSVCAAKEMGFLSVREMGDRLSAALDTLERMDVWKGHFYNWYDLATLRPLPPRFVSTVDSGNLAGCLFACAQLCRRHLAEMPGEARALPARLDALFERTDFAALYDPKERLLAVGYDADKRRLTPARYDLLASEARLASFIGIMRGQLPRKHWARLGRPTARCGGGAALLSWGGTMFEYWMPHLLLPLIRGTLMGEGCLSAARAQMAAHPQRPFGVSECGYYAFDADWNYQYRAFGLPSLALSGETAGRVTAPYASVLTLPFFPRSAAANVERMLLLGWRDGHGLVEAADYSLGGSPRLVRSHMAHHQGMILCALCNALEGEALIRAFMSPPAARANADLLWERAPGRPRRRAALPASRRQPPLPGPCRRTARKGLPIEAHALAAGRLTWVLTADGQGYLAYRDALITRFPGDAAAPSGPQLYLRSPATGAVCRPMAEGRAVFESGRVRFFMDWENVAARVDCCCAPLTAAALLRLTMENNGPEPREIEAATYLEAALSAPEEDRTHPNYRDLSVTVRPLGNRGLTARRLPRDERDRALAVDHFALGDIQRVTCQGDRTLFLGRMGSPARPEQLLFPADACVFRTGDVIAPCLSLRGRIVLQPGEKKTALFVTACREGAGAPPEAWLRPDTWRDTFSLAYAQDQMTLRELGMGAQDLHAAQRVLGALLFPGQTARNAPAAPPDALWRLGISGTLPTWMVSLSGADGALLRRALRCHAWMRRQGVKTDLILFCPQEGDYLRPVLEAARRALAVSPSRALGGAPGGVGIVSGDGETRRAAESRCRLVLHSGKPLEAQLTSPPRPLPRAAGGALIPRPVLPPKWQDDNSFGGFALNGDYGIVRPCPAPWHQMLCGARFGTLVCETGILTSYADNSRLGRVTRMNADAHRGVPAEEIYLKDADGALYSLTMPTALYSPGIAEYRCLCGGVFSHLTVFSLESRAAGARTLTLRCEEERKVTVYWAVRFALGEDAENTRCRVRQDMALAENGGKTLGWAALRGARCRILPAAWYGPSALDGEDSGAGSVAVFSLETAARPRETEKITLLLGAAPDERAAWTDKEFLFTRDAGQMERSVRALWQERLGGMTLFAGDKLLERMLNRWLPYQAVSARLLARMGPYQPGGAWGFRDQIQDLLILLHTRPQAARAHLLLCAAHQYEEGDVQHWWHPPRRGVRTRISDDLLFLPWMTARYVQITGDQSILSEEAPYLRSRPLLPEEKDRYEEPEVSPLRETLARHCVRAIDRVAFGAHGLPLMRGGDWNDGMDRVGGEKGESVWLGFFLACVLREFAPLCDGETKDRYQALRRRLLSDGEKAWTGQWYLRAWFDGGAPLAGPDTRPPRIDLISQAFAVLAGAPRMHARQAVMNALKMLYDREAGLVKLLDPPFAPEEGAGYIGAYLPGVRENGGQYTHAVPWLILALCKIGEYAWAWEIARNILPTYHADSREKALRYRVEPYVLSGDVYAGENRGRGGWTWYTGSAAWTYYVWITALLGFEKRGDRARLVPCPGGGMEEFTLVYQFGASRWHFTASRDTAFATLDGEKLPDGWAPLTDDGKTHEARFPMR